MSSWRLLDTVIYVTLEPCLMCAGAILQARIRTSCTARRPEGRRGPHALQRLRRPAPGSLRRGHRGVLADDQVDLVQEFFQERR